MNESDKTMPLFTGSFTNSFPLTQRNGACKNKFLKRPSRYVKNRHFLYTPRSLFRLKNFPSLIENWCLPISNPSDWFCLCFVPTAWRIPKTCKQKKKKHATRTSNLLAKCGARKYDFFFFLLARAVRHLEKKNLPAISASTSLDKFFKYKYTYIINIRAWGSRRKKKQIFFVAHWTNQLRLR